MSDDPYDPRNWDGPPENRPIDHDKIRERKQRRDESMERLAASDDPTTAEMAAGHTKTTETRYEYELSRNEIEQALANHTYFEDKHVSTDHKNAGAPTIGLTFLYDGGDESGDIVGCVVVASVRDVVHGAGE